MSTCRSIAETEPADIQKRYEVTPNGQVELVQIEAVSLLLPFKAVQPLVEAGAVPRRPNRNRPIHSVELSIELEAWDTASEEVWKNIE